MRPTRSSHTPLQSLQGLKYRSSQPSIQPVRGVYAESSFSRKECVEFRRCGRRTLSPWHGKCRFCFDFGSSHYRLRSSHPGPGSLQLRHGGSGEKEPHYCHCAGSQCDSRNSLRGKDQRQRRSSSLSLFHSFRRAPHRPDIERFFGSHLGNSSARRNQRIHRPRFQPRLEACHGFGPPSDSRGGSIEGYGDDQPGERNSGFWRDAAAVR